MDYGSSFYEYEHDSYYCYDDVGVLKNLLNIKDQNELQKAEREITSLRIAQLMKFPPKGTFNFAFLQKIHKLLFSDIYEWAGKIRTVNISKGNQFCRCEYIEAQMARIMKELAADKYLAGKNMNELAFALGYYLGEINAIHPFREGNGRTQRLFIQLLAQKNGYEIDYSKISSEDMLEASKQTFNLKYDFMAQILLRAMQER